MEAKAQEHITELPVAKCFPKGKENAMEERIQKGIPKIIFMVKDCLEREERRLQCLSAAFMIVNTAYRQEYEAAKNGRQCEFIADGLNYLHDLLEDKVSEEGGDALIIRDHLTEALTALTPPATGLEVGESAAEATGETKKADWGKVSTVSEAMALLQSIRDLHGGDIVVQDEHGSPVNIVYYEKGSDGGPTETDYSCVTVCGG
jgi:hypothetical protein